jgi:predicted lipid-binding transport protein (Tim44 family)
MLTGTTEEEGTDLPTVVAPDVKSAFAALSQRDPAFDWASFVKRVELVFHTFHRAWSSQELTPVRPFLSDNLFETQSYWVAAYQAQRLRNITEDPQIVSIALSRVLHDKVYDAVTVRVFAQCKDYTLDASDRMVGGSRENPRQYSEYWTFIRSAARAGAPGTEPKCPSCGVANPVLDVAGHCQSCHVKVTTGEFDWTLSRIEQDEVYRL